jgi:putative transposase
MIVDQYVKQVGVTKLLHWLTLPSSSYYDKPRTGKRGRKPSTHTPYKGDMIENAKVVDQIKEIIMQPYNAYGYQNVSDELNEMGYWINDKKTYRLMDENNLLLGKVIRCKGKRTWVQFRKVQATKPMEWLCLDIKYIWVHGEGRWYYQLSIMDIYSRKILIWILQKSVRKNDVINMFRQLHLEYGLKGVMIRNDNGSQFLANAVRQTLQQMKAKQEFTHVATPEENAYIESFHSIQQRELINRYEFISYFDAKTHIEKYMHWYNHIRKHRKLGRITPQQKWDQYYASLTVTQSERTDADYLSRPVDTIEKQTINQLSGPSLDKLEADVYLCGTGEHKVINYYKSNQPILSN